MYIQFQKSLVAGVLALGLTSSIVSADSLQQIFDLASVNDAQIRAAEARLQANLEQRNLGRAGMLPQISLSGSYSDGSFSPQGNSGSIDNQISRYSANLNQALFDLPAWYSFKQGDAVAKQAEQDYLVAKQTLIVRTTTAYLNVLRALDNLQATKSEEVALASRLNQSQQRYKAGLVAITDIHEVQAAYDNVAARLINALGNVGIAFENLSVLTNQNHTSIAPLKADFPIDNPSPTSAEDWVELALTNNFELKSVMLARDASGFNAQSKKWQHLPSLSLGLSYSESDIEVSGTNVQQFPGNYGDSTAISLSLDVPLYLGGSTSAARRQAYYQHVSSEETLNNARRSLVQRTRNQYLGVQIDVAETRARKQAVKSSQSAYEATKAGYEVGTRNLIDLLNAEQSLYQARRNYANARYDYIIDLFALNQLAGALNSANIADINSWLDPSKAIPRSIVEQSLPSNIQ